MPFVLSHHPECEKFSENHYITIRGIKLCIGCFFTIPTIVGLVLLQGIFHYWRLIPTSLAFAVVGGVSMIQVCAFLDVGKGSLGWKLFTKIAHGIGFVAVFLLIFRLPIAEVWKWIFSYVFYFTTGSLIGFIRAYRMDAVCSNCPEYAAFPMCYGFTHILERLQTHGFIEVTKREKTHQ